MKKIIIISIIVLSIIWFIVILALCKAAKDDKELEEYYNDLEDLYNRDKKNKD